MLLFYLKELSSTRISTLKLLRCRAGLIRQIVSAVVCQYRFYQLLTPKIGMLLGLLILTTARLFVPYEIAHPVWMLGFLLLTAITFSLFGFIIGLWADSFQKLQVIPLMVVTPLTFLGGSFYSITMLPPFWQKLALFNPVVYLVSGFRWSFYGTADVPVGLSLAAIVGFLALCLTGIYWIFRTGYKLKA